MKREELNEIASRHKKNMGDIKKEMRIMANAGYFYYCTETSKVLNPEEYGKYFTENGFNVEVNDSYFQIKW